jgi:hypothetical protein
MNELTVMRDFRAERDTEPPEAHDAIWRALEARMDAAAAEARSFGEAVAGAELPARSGGAGDGGRRRGGFASRGRGGSSPRPGSLSRRRRLGLTFAGAVAGAAVVAGALVLNSGPTAQPASAAEILHEAAANAAGLEAPATLVPGPGQYLFRKEQNLAVQSWRYPVPTMDSGLATGSIGGLMHGPHVYNALVPVTTTSWMNEKAAGRRREELGDLQFWSPKEEARWKAAGSPAPQQFNPEFRRTYPDSYEGPEVNQIGPKVIDMDSKGFGNFTFPDTSKVPTEAKALREAAEGNELEYTAFNHVGGPTPKRLDAQETKEELLNVLQEGYPSPALQAAIFGALAELPGISVLTGVTDGAGRQGDAIVGKVGNGVQQQTIFDPDSGELLGYRSILVDPAAYPSYGEIPAGTPISERVFLEVGVVDSTEATPGEAG